MIEQIHNIFLDGAMVQWRCQNISTHRSSGEKRLLNPEVMLQMGNKGLLEPEVMLEVEGKIYVH